MPRTVGTILKIHELIQGTQKRICCCICGNTLKKLGNILEIRKHENISRNLEIIDEEYGKDIHL